MEDWLSYSVEDGVFSENWAVVLAGKDRHIIYLSFVRYMKPKPANCTVSVSITTPGNKTYVINKSYDLDDFTESAETGTIKVGGNEITLLNGKARIKVKDEGHNEEGETVAIELDVSLDPWMAGVKLHSGKLFFDKEETRWVQIMMPVPRADVSGGFNIAGEQFDFAGAGQILHVRDHERPDSYASKWAVCRYFGKKHTVIFTAFDTTASFGSSPVRRIVVTDRSKVLIHDDRFIFETGDPKVVSEAHTYDNLFGLRYSGDEFVMNGTAKGKKLHETFRIAEGLNFLKRMGAKMLKLNPAAFRIRGKCSFTLKEKEGRKTRTRGPCLMENILPR